ncbi:MAG: erythromycin esterase family protein [Egibacteraceae bacterium]
MTAGEHEREVRVGLADLAADLRTLDPLDDLEDLAPLAGMVGDARIVALGENAHFVHEFYLARHRIVRVLVERLGFRAFGLESGLVEGFTVDDWVHGGEGDLDTVLTSGCTNFMGSSKEFGDQLAWMRAHNQAARSGSRTVGYFGFDSTHDLIAALGLLIAYLDRVDPDLAGFCRQELAPVAEQWDARVSAGWHFGLIERYQAMEAAVRDRWSLLLADLELVLADRSLDYIAWSSPREFARAQWRARSIRQFASMYRNMPPTAYFGPVPNMTTSRNARDVFMLENIEGVLRELGPDARIVLAAHNSHIARYPLAMKGSAREWGETEIFPGTGATMVGQYLGARFGSPTSRSCSRPGPVTSRRGSGSRVMER